MRWIGDRGRGGGGGGGDEGGDGGAGGGGGGVHLRRFFEYTILTVESSSFQLV